MPTVSRLNDKAVLERGDYEPLIHADRVETE